MLTCICSLKRVWHPLAPDKILLHNENLELYLRLGLKFKQSQWLKSYVEFKTQKRIEAEKNGGKDRKAYMVKQWKNWEKELM